MQYNLYNNHKISITNYTKYFLLFFNYNIFKMYESSYAIYFL